MPRWTTTPPAETHHTTLPIIRTPARGEFSGLITSPDQIGCPTHYWHGRTIPCEANDCEPCQQGNPWRYHAYLTIWSRKKNEHYLFEFTQQAANKIAEYREKHGTLRGHLLTAHRPSQKPNGRIQILLQPIDLSSIDIPRPVDIQTILLHLWAMDRQSPTNDTPRPSRAKTHKLNEATRPDPTPIATITQQIINHTTNPNGD